MGVQQTNSEVYQASVNQAQEPRALERTVARKGHPAAHDRLTKTDKGQKSRFVNNKAPVGRDPLAGKESSPESDGGYPITDSVFSGASAAYYAALFAYDAVKSMGTVQQAYNTQEVDSFQQLVTAWNQYTHEDGEFIKKQGQSYIYAGVASFAFGVVGSAGAMVWGVGNPKGWFEGLGGMENVEGNIAEYYSENTEDSEFTVENGGEDENVTNETASRVREQTEISDDSSDSEEDGETAVERRSNRIELEADENVQRQRARASENDGIDDADTESKTENKKKENQVKYWQERLQKHTSTFQMIAQLINTLASTGQGVGQGAGQWATAGTKQNMDSYDKAKQLTQQVFQTEDQGWSSAVQTLKEMTGTAANEINQLAAAEQRA